MLLGNEIVFTLFHISIINKTIEYTSHNEITTLLILFGGRLILLTVHKSTVQPNQYLFVITNTDRLSDKTVILMIKEQSE